MWRDRREALRRLGRRNVDACAAAAVGAVDQVRETPAAVLDADLVAARRIAVRIAKLELHVRAVMVARGRERRFPDVATLKAALLTEI